MLLFDPGLKFHHAIAASYDIATLLFVPTLADLWHVSKHAFMVLPGRLLSGVITIP